MTKRYLILARNTRINETGLQTSAGHRTFQPGKSGLYIKDAAEAREIETQYGAKGTNDVHVFEDDKVARHVRNDSGEIHNYTFSGVDTDHFKVWVKRRGKLVRVTKAQARAKGYKIVSEGRRANG